MTDKSNAHGAGAQRSPISSPSPDAPPQAASASREPPPASGEMVALDFLWRTHGRLNEDARFADTKALAVIMLASTLIATMQAVKLHLTVLSQGPGQWGILGFLAAFAYILLGAGLLLAAWSIKPRLTKAHDKGFPFWESILGYPTASEFWRDFGAHDVRDLAEHMADHVHTLAGVCRRKYYWMGLSMWALFLGGAAAAVAILLRDVLVKAA